MEYIGCPKCYKTMRKDGSPCPHCGYQPTPAPAPVVQAPNEGSRSEPPAVPLDVVEQLKAEGAGDESILCAVHCRHGEDQSGWLIATTRCIWWFGKLRGIGSLLMKKSGERLSYSWPVTVHASNATFSALVAIRAGAFNMVRKPATLHIGNEYFQMQTGEAERFAKVVRDYQVSLADAEASQREEAAQAGRSAAPLSIADELSKLAALKDRGILTDEEFTAMKAEMLKKACL